MVCESLILPGASGRTVLRHSENSVEYRSASLDRLSVEVMIQQCPQASGEESVSVLHREILDPSVRHSFDSFNTLFQEDILIGWIRMQISTA